MVGQMLSGNNSYGGYISIVPINGNQNVCVIAYKAA